VHELLEKEFIGHDMEIGLYLRNAGLLINNPVFSNDQNGIPLRDAIFLSYFSFSLSFLA
jgi:hypothetical protein